MKRIYRLILVWATMLPAISAMTQNIGINSTGAAAHASAMLDVSSTNKGMLAPRMTTAQRNAIATPAKGLLVYDTEVSSLFHFNGTSWVNLSAGGGGFSLPFVASENLNTNVFQISNSGTGAAISATTTNEFGFALAGISNSAYGYGVYGYAGASDAVAVYGFAGDATALRGHSTGGLGLDARSTNNSAIKASILLGANANPTILATHAGVGIGVDASSNSGSAIRGISGTGVGVRGESNTNTGIGVLGYSSNNVGVSAGTLGGTAVLASALSGIALKGSSSSGYALDISGKVKISGGNTTPQTGAVLTSIDASGNAVWKQQKIAFSVYGRHVNYTSIPHNTTRKMHFSTVEYDYAENYSLYTGGTPTANSSTFLVPINGLYHFNIKVALELIESSFTDDFTEIIATLRRTRSGNTIDVAVLDAGCCMEKDWKYFLYGGFDIPLLQGDRIHMEVTQRNDGSKSAAINIPMSLSGHLVFAD